MARYRRTTRRAASRTTRRSPVRARRSYGGGYSRRRVRSSRTTGRAQTVRIVVQGAPAASSAPLMLSEAGRLVAPTSQARSRF